METDDRFGMLRLGLLVCLLSAPLSARADSGQTSPAIVPSTVITLFNGKDLTPFYTWLRRGLGYSDADRVFSVVDNVDGAPAIRISGQHYGGIVTRERYANYRLVAEFRWGLITWAPRKDRTRDSGILLHCQGPDGNRAKTFDAPWMRSVEFQIIEGGTGDVILVSGFDRGADEATFPRLVVNTRDGDLHWHPRGVATEFDGSSPKRNWIGWQHRDREWKDVLGYRGPKDVEKPVGEWNRLEAVCDGGDITYFVNGVKVMEGRDGTYREGKILFQSEGAELFFRRIELHPLRR